MISSMCSRTISMFHSQNSEFGCGVPYPLAPVGVEVRLLHPSVGVHLNSAALLHICEKLSFSSNQERSLDWEALVPGLFSETRRQIDPSVKILVPCWEDRSFDQVCSIGSGRVVHGLRRLGMSLSPNSYVVNDVDLLLGKKYTLLGYKEGFQSVRHFELLCNREGFKVTHTFAYADDGVVVYSPIVSAGNTEICVVPTNTLSLYNSALELACSRLMAYEVVYPGAIHSFFSWKIHHERFRFLDKWLFLGVPGVLGAISASYASMGVTDIPPGFVLCKKHCHRILVENEHLWLHTHIRMCDVP